MEPPLRVHVDADVLPGPIRLKVTGHLTADTCRSLFDVLDPALTLHGCPSVTIDLLAVTTFDPAGIQCLKNFIALCQATGDVPAIHIVGLPPENESHQDFEPAQRTRVHKLMSPIGPTVLHSQLLKDTARHIASRGEPVVVMDAEHQAHSILTEADIAWVAEDHPETWHQMPCGELAGTAEHTLSTQDSLIEVLGEYHQGRIRPLLVFDAREAVGVLHPTAVFQWCAEHHPILLTTLSIQALKNVSEAAEPALSSVFDKPRDRTAQ